MDNPNEENIWINPPHPRRRANYEIIIKMLGGSSMKYEVFFDEDTAVKILQDLKGNNLIRLGTVTSSYWTGECCHILYLHHNGRINMSLDTVEFYLSKSLTEKLKNKLMDFCTDYIKYKDAPNDIKFKENY